MPAYRGPDGKIVYASDEDAGRFEAGGYERVGEAAAGAAQNRIAPVDNGIAGSIGATVSAGLSGATLGASDWLLKGVLDKGQFEQMAQDRADNPGLAGAAQFAGAFLPAVVSGGTATPSGYLSHLAAEGIGSAEAVGGAAGAVKSLAIAGSEGAIQNAGVYLSDVALGDRDLTAEGMVGALGTGFAFGGGGLIAGHGLSAGTTAARRMFARYAAGGEEAALAAKSAWQEQSAKALESFDQAATTAETKLQEAQLARQQADLARKQASAAVAEAKIAPPPPETAVAGVEAAMPGAAPAVSPEIEIAGLMRDRAMAATDPARMAAWDAQNGQRLQDLMAARVNGAAPADPLEAMAQMPGVKRSGPDTAVREFGYQRVPGQHAVTPEEAELAAKLSEYRAARDAFHDTHASVDPELDDVLRGSLGGDVQRDPVPVGEFGAPGARGYDPGNVREPGPPSQAPIANAPEGTPVTRALRKPTAPGEPTTAFDFKDSGLTFDKETRNYFAKEEGGALGQQSEHEIGFSRHPKPLDPAEFDSLSSSWRTSLQPEAKQALETYSRNGTFSLINGPLRTSGDIADVPEHLHGTVHEIDKAIASAPAERDLVAYRGVNGVRSTKQWGEVQPGDSIVDHGFGSTSALPDVGASYAKGMGVRSGVELRVTVPRGYPAAPIPSEIFGAERELLLPRNTKYTVTGVESGPGGVKIVHVTASPAAEGEVSRVAAADIKPPAIEDMNLRQLDEHMAKLEQRKNELDRPGTRDSDEYKQVRADMESAYERHRAIKRGEVPEPKGVAVHSPKGWRPDSGSPEPKMARPYGGKYSAAGGVVFNGEGKIAITRPNGGGAREEWALPKGRIDPGETPSQAALREVLEESGAHGEIHQHIGDYEGEHSNARFYAMRHTGDDLAAMAANGETAEVRFVTPDEAERMLTRPQEQKVVADARRMLGEKGGDFWSGAHVRGTKPAAPTDTLTGLLRGTKTKLDAGESLVEMGAPARAAYATAKAARTKEAAEHFRAKATAAQASTGSSDFQSIPEHDYIAHRKSFEEKLSPDERKAIDTYTSSTYKDINRALRHEEIRNGREGFVSKIDEAVAKNPLHDNAKLYRGLSGDEAKQFRSLEVGDTFEEKAFTSTSSSPDAFKREVNLHIDVPAGYEAAPVPSSIDEKEWLLRRNTRFEVTGIQDHGATRTINVRVVDSPPPRPVEEMASTKTGRLPDAPPVAIVKGARATSEGGDLMSALQGTKQGLDSGKGLREIAGHAPAEHPLAMKQLEMAHDDALERVAAAKEPAEKAAAQAEARAIEQQMTAVGKKPGAVEDVAVMAPAVHRLEKAATELTEALGPEAPAAAQAHAKAFRDAEDTATQKSVSRAARAADDHASTQERAQADDLVNGPSARERAVAAAKRQRAEAEAAYQRAQVAEAEASIGAKQAKRAASEARKNLPPPPAAAPAQAGKSLGGRIVSGAHAIGYAAELGSDVGIPGIPRPHDIPVIGPLLSAYLKYRAFRAAAGRFMGRIPATAETKAAELAARTRDGIARSMDRSLGLIERNPTAVRTALTLGAVRASEALSKRLIDDGHPDAPDGASVSQLAAVRMREVASAVANPTLISDMVRQQTRNVVDPDLITALENHLTAMFAHLNDTAPKGPPPNPLAKQDWKPPAAAALQWGQRLAVAQRPQVAFDLLEAGKLTPSAADTLRICYQKLFAEAQARLAQRAADLKNPVPYRQLMQAGLLFDTPTHASLDPENATVLQQAHVAPPQPAPQPTAPPVPGVAAPTNVNALYQTTADRRAAR